jgi:tight adherence protein C
MSPFLVSLTFFCLIGVAATAVYALFYGSHKVMQERFEEMTMQARTAAVAGVGDEPIALGMGRALLQWALQRIPAPRKSRATDKLGRLLVQAGARRSNAVRIFMLVRLISIAAGALIGFIAGLIFLDAGPHALLTGMIGATIGFYAPIYLLRKRARKRQEEITRGLSDVLDLLVVCVEAGLGLFEAIKVVGEETARHGQAIGIELTLVAGEVAAGATLGEGLRHLGDRTAVEDVRPLAATLIQSEQLGAQVGPALRASSDSLRTKRRLRAEEAAQKSTIKILFPLVLFVLPAMLLVILGPAIIAALRTFSF